jgi:hypothetical protein
MEKTEEKEEEGKPSMVEEALDKEIDKRIGNRFWLARSRHGRKPIFASAAMLEEACADYFKWSDDNPLIEKKPYHANGLITYANVEKMRAMTIGGLCIFIDIAHSTWREWRTREDFSTIVAEVEAIIRNQKFSGAAADMLNANIIARDLGLSDKKELSGPDGGPIETVQKLTTIEAVKAEMAKRGIPPIEEL